MHRGRLWTGGLFIGFGMAFVLLEVGLHTYSAISRHNHYDINHAVLGIAGLSVFIGLYILNPKMAKDGGQFVVDNTAKVLQIVRMGLRKTNLIGVVVLPTEETKTPEPPAGDKQG